jgi:Spy/CpxP family protein refolding chaperone
MRLLSAVLTAVVALSVCAKLNAADEKKSDRRGGAMGMMGPGMFLPRDLNLTDEQKSKRDAIFKEAREDGEKILTDEQKKAFKDAMEKAKSEKSKEAFQALRSAVKFTDEQKAKMEDLRKKTREKIMAILTAEQKEKLEKAEKEMKERSKDRKKREN